MGAWGCGPLDNDNVADWFGDLMGQTAFRDEVVAGLKSGCPDTVRGAAWVIGNLAKVYVWPIDFLDADRIAAGAGILELLHDEDWLEMWGSQAEVKKSLRKQLNALELSSEELTQAADAASVAAPRSAKATKKKATKKKATKKKATKKKATKKKATKKKATKKKATKKKATKKKATKKKATKKKATKKKATKKKATKKKATKKKATKKKATKKQATKKKATKKKATKKKATKKKATKKKATKKKATKGWICLEFKDGKSSKFWQIKVSGSSHTVRYGRIGTSGQEKSKSFESPAVARAAAEKLEAQKRKKGYS
jgi:predicted DNA-binding WGR domain protein